MSHDKTVKMGYVFISQVEGGGFAASFGTNRGKFVQQKPKTPAAIFVFNFLFLYCVAEGKSAKPLLQECKRVFERGEALRKKFGLEGANVLSECDCR